MLRAVTYRNADDWEELARREPYFSVFNSQGLPDVESGDLPSEEYFATGEADVAALLSAITPFFDHQLSLGAVLDFGCGAGRLTIPLAQRAVRVIACDVSPTMLAHARRNTELTGLHNVTFIPLEKLADLPLRHFDFICSLLVFQHIPASAGYDLIRTLIGLLRPGGVAALQVRFRRATANLGWFGRSAHPRSRLARHEAVEQSETGGDSRSDDYAQRVVLRDITAAGARLVARLMTSDGPMPSTVLLVAKS